MDLEKQLEMQRNETSCALQVLLGYVEKLTTRNLDKKRKKLEQLKSFH